MVEFEKVPYSPDLKMVLIFLVTKGFLKGTMHVQLSNCLTLTWNATSRNGQRQARWPKCAATPPPGKLAAQLKSRFGDSCLKLIWTFLETPGGVIQLQSDLLHTPIWAFSCRDSHFVVPKHWNGDHVGVPKQPFGNWTLFLRASKEGTRPGLYLMHPHKHIIGQW